MYSLSIAVGDEGFTCDKCREIVRLTEKVLELETRIQTLVEDSKNVRAVDTALDVTSSGTPVHCSVSGRACAAGATGWQWGSIVAGQNTALPFRSEHQTVLPTQWRTHWETWWKCSSYWRFYCTERENRDTSHHSPLFTGSQSAWHLGNLKVLANAKRKFSKIVIHAGANDVRLRQSEITKNNVKEVCALASTMSGHCNMLWPPPCLSGWWDS